MMVGRSVVEGAQSAARALIVSKGLELAAKEIRVSLYLLAKAAAGAKVSPLSADALEARLLCLEGEAA